MNGLAPPRPICPSLRARAGRTGSIPICAASTATTPDPPAGITACLRMSQCRMCYGNFRGSACSIIRKALTPLEYDLAMADLVSYLVWMAEPTQQQRKRIGVWVVLFLGIFSVLAWRLNAAYWHRIKAD